jgi:hypothetical protein
MYEEAVVPRSRSDVRQSWVERLARFASSGLSVVSFCRAEGVSTQAFYYWKQKLAAAAPATSADADRLVPVHLLCAASTVEVVLPAGFVLRVSPGCDLHFVRSLVAALEMSPC